MIVGASRSAYNRAASITRNAASHGTRLSVCPLARSVELPAPSTTTTLAPRASAAVAIGRYPPPCRPANHSANAGDATTQYDAATAGKYQRASRAVLFTNASTTPAPSTTIMNVTSAGRAKCFRKSTSGSTTDHAPPRHLQRLGGRTLRQDEAQQPACGQRRNEAECRRPHEPEGRMVLDVVTRERAGDAGD